MTELAKWDSFYVIVGSAAGALIGLQFVVLTLIAARPISASAEAGAAFGSPTVVHFGVVLFLSALLHIPWQTVTIDGFLWGALGFGGVVYEIIVIRRMKKQATYEPVFEDWLFHAALPLAGYVILALSSFAALSRPRQALFGVGGAALLLLFIGIHNAWDGVSYHVLVTSRMRIIRAGEREANRKTSRGIDMDPKNMPAHNDTLKNRLSRDSEIKITVTGRKSGRPISIPVWFVAEDDTLYLLPVHGSDTQWYKNALKNPKIEIDARGEGTELKAVPITDAAKVSSVVEKFRGKYGAGDVKKYYSKFDVAVLAQMQ